MLDATITVVGKIIILVLMMAVGFVCAKFRMITSRGASQITSLIVNIVSPCLIIMSFQTDVEGVSKMCIRDSTCTACKVCFDLL